MKKSLVALAALAATSAFAQSTVTIYGQADAAYTSVKNADNSFVGLAGAGRGSNFLGFMGTEDLGGGLKANFKLEAQYNLDSGAGNASNTNNQATGTVTTLNGTSAAPTLAAAPSTRASLAGAQGLTFNRYSYVGVSGGFGEVRLGRDYTSTFNAVLGADTTGANGVQNTLFQTLAIGQTNSHANATSASNMIGYETPDMNGVKLKVQQFLGESVNGATAAMNTLQPNKAGNGSSWHLSYAKGPLAGGVASQKTKGTAAGAWSNATSATATDATAATGAVPGDYQIDAMYAKYDFGKVLLTAGQVTEKMISGGTYWGGANLAAGTLTAGTAGELKNKSTIFGFSYPVNATVKINGTYIKSKYTIAGADKGEATQIGLQALYALSKRTDLYANYATTDNTDGNKYYGIGNGSGRLVTVSTGGDKTTAYQIGVRHSF